MPITIDKIKEKRVQRRTLQEQGEQVLTDLYAARAAKDATRAKELEESFERIHADIEQLGADIEREERAYDSAQKIEEDERRGLQLESVVAGNADADPEDETRERGAPEQHAEQRKTLENKAIRSYLLRGAHNLTPEESRIVWPQQEERAMSVGDDESGGFLVPAGFQAELEKAMASFGGMRRAKTRVLRTAKGGDLSWPTTNDTSNKGRLLGEGAPATKTDITVGSIVLKDYTYSSDEVVISRQLLQDSAINLEQELALMLGERLGRITNEHFTIGTGAAQPEGVVTGSVQGVQGATGQTATVLVDDLYALKHSVDPDYRQGAEWMFSDNTLLKIKQLKDGDGRPMWQSGIAIREPNTIDGDTYVINQDMADMAASAKSILYGLFAKYLIRDVLGFTLLRLTERHAENFQIAFLAFSRHDGKLIDAGTNPIKHYANSAS